MNGSSHNKSNINTKKKTDDEVHHHPQVSTTSALDAISDHSRRSNGKSSNNHNIKRGNIAVSSSSGRNKRTKVLSNLFYVGIVLTLFLALIQVFDPTLDEHITTIRRQQLQQEFYNNNNLLQQNGNPFIIRRQSIQNNQEVIVEGNNNNDHNNNGNSYNQKDGGRGRILQLLNEAGLYNVTSDQMEKLPSWNDIRQLYGDDIIILGNETCSQFRSTIRHDDIILGVAGMFNTGTNFLDIQMQQNIIGLTQKSIWQVPWGKHRMAYVKWNHTAPSMDKYNKTNVFPIIVIRDPYSWMQSMCKSPYAALWRHKKHHCPNLVPSPEVDSAHYPPAVLKKSAFPVTVEFDEKHLVHFTSLAHLWSEWYKLYINVDYPALMIRYEDLVFQPTKVLHEIAKCVGAEVREDIVFQLHSSKQHGSGTDYIKAITKTADINARVHNMTFNDFNYATQHLDSQLMKMFRYVHPSELNDNN